MIQTLIIAFLLSFTLSFILAPVSIKLAKLFGLIDDPKINKHPKVLHKTPLPRGGVIGIAIAIIIVTILFLNVDARIAAVLAGVVILTVQGLIDDKYDISPYTRLFVQVFAAAIPILAGIGISYITNPLGGIIDLSQPQIAFEFLGKTRHLWILSNIFGLLWIVALMNFMNMGAKGVAGQLSGIVGVAAFVIVLLTLKFIADPTEAQVTVFAMIISGAYFGFLPWHFSPQRIMPGFGGSTVAGYLLAILAILTTTKVGTLLVVLGVPLIDTSYTIIRRIKEGKSPVRGDRGHLHHKLLDLGWSQQKIAVFYWGITALLGVIALNIQAADKLYTILGIAILLGGFLIWYRTRQKQL